MTTLAFIDCETTGLDPDRHEVWEIALILRRDDGEEFEHEWQLPVNLAEADPNALRIGRFYERRKTFRGSQTQSVATLSYFRTGAPINEVARWQGHSAHEMAEHVAVRLDGATLVGAVPNFDAEFLKHWLNDHGQAATWDYHLVDVEVLAAGETKTEPPWNSDDLARWVGVDPEKFERHTALGDARWARAIYDAVMS